jgi:hypothetical protein
MKEAGSRESRFDISYFDGMNSSVQQRLSKRSELSHMENARAPIIGVLEKRRGQSKVHDGFSVAANYGIIQLDTTAVGQKGVFRLSAPSSTVNIYSLSTTNTWELLADADAQGIASGEFSWAKVDGNLILVNRQSDNRMLKEDGATVITSAQAGSLYNSPRASKVAFYKNRIYLADYIVGSIRYKTTVVRSSYPLGIIALANGDYDNGGGTDDWVIPVTDTNYIYSASGANQYEIYRGSIKIATITLSSIQETTVTATNANVVFESGFTSINSADEFWVYGTYTGEKQYRWINNASTTGRDVKQYNTFRLAGGDEDPITLMEPIGNVLLIGNKNTLLSWNDYTLENMDYGIGCVSSKGYVKLLGTLYFLHYNGIYATNGGAPQLLSRKVQKYLDGATKEGVETAAAGYKGFSVFFAIGDVALKKDDGSSWKTLKDVCLEYSVVDENWYVHTNVPAEHFTTYIDSLGTERLLINHSGTGKYTKEFLDESSTTDDGSEIFMRVDTQDMQLMQEFETYANPTSVIIDMDRGAMLKAFVSLDGEDFYELEGTAKKGATILKINSREKGTSSPSLCRKIKVSFRDMSKQICRISQAAITYLPSTIDLSE